MLRLTHHFHAPARLLMSTLFLLSGVGKLGAIKATQEYMEAYGVSGYLIYPAAALEITGGVMLLLGVFTRPLSLVLAGWCLLTAAIFHKELTDQTQQIMFLKNMAMAGGFLVLSDHGAPGHSLDDPLSLAQKYKKNPPLGNDDENEHTRLLSSEKRDLVRYENGLFYEA